MPESILYLPVTNKANEVRGELLQKIIRAQQNLTESEFQSAADLWKRTVDDLKLNLPPTPDLKDKTVREMADKPLSQLIAELQAPLAKAGIPESAVALQAFSIANRIHLLLAFDDPDAALSRVTAKVTSISATFPRTAEDIERGRNPGDVLDPYILAAAQTLLFGGDFTKAISATVAHKTLMIIEGLMGHLHEDVIGDMRGNVRIPEPRGVDQEKLDFTLNPFPGADLLQPPTKKGEAIRFHQVKSKTGSAKGGDGKRLGDQLLRLANVYDAEIYYDALIGSTLRGHRSKAGVEQAAPGIVVLVGEAAFQELTRCLVGPELLLRVYQNSFQAAAVASGYSVEQMAIQIVRTFQARADKHGAGFLEVVLHDSVSGVREEQDSRYFNKGRGTRGKR
jgi:hypothetical protein